MIYKKEDKNIISNWRPITLINYAYKIFTKALALKLSDHMNEWDQTQIERIHQRQVYLG